MRRILVAICNIILPVAGMGVIGGFFFLSSWISLSLMEVAPHFPPIWLIGAWELAFGVVMGCGWVLYRHEESTP